jgi:hypothetical protein
MQTRSIDIDLAKCPLIKIDDIFLPKDINSSNSFNENMIDFK